jgi:hypothetical protein
MTFYKIISFSDVLMIQLHMESFTFEKEMKVHESAMSLLCKF